MCSLLSTFLIPFYILGVSLLNKAALVSERKHFIRLKGYLLRERYKVKPGTHVDN